MQAPTLIVGIGGIGGRVVQLLAQRIRHDKLNDVALVVMDTDVNDLRAIHTKFPEIYTVQTSPKGTVGKALDNNEYARERWFPVNDGLTGKPFTEGAGQVRAVSRLAFDHAVEQGLMENLEKAIAKLHGLSGDAMRQEMRVIITGSIAGGTGSGLVLPVAMYIRNFLITRYQDNSAIIRGFFLEPDVVFGRLVDEEERNTQRANAYAAVRELDAFFRKEYSGAGDEYAHIVFNAPQPGLGERVDYPNILPYHFVFLMDALNAEGDSLTDAEGRYDLEGYQRHAADCIYAQALSVVSSRSNSSEDNVIRKLAANNGRSRYCGAGSSCIEYPMETVRRYIALNWAKQTLSGEWLEIDKEFKRRSRDEKELKLPSFYMTEYDGKRGTNSSFYKSIMSRAERRDNDGNLIDVIGFYIGSLDDHARSWAKTGFLTSAPSIAKVNMDDGSKMPSDVEAIKERYSDDDDPTMSIQNDFGNYFHSINRYSAVAQEEAPDTIKTFTTSAFIVSDYDTDPLNNRDKDWQLESIFKITDGNENGTFHPAAIRYMLYKLTDILEESAQEAEDKARSAREAMRAAEKDDYYGETEEVEDVDKAIGMIMDDSGKKKFKIPIFGKNEMTDDQAENIAQIGHRLNEYKENVDIFIEETSVAQFMSNAANYVKGLAASYEDFYNYLDKQIEAISVEIDAIEKDPRFNNAKGRTYRYICSNRRCLEKILDHCQLKISSGELPIELCGDIYVRLLRYAKERARNQSYAARNELSSDIFKRLFEDTVINYWMESTLDTHNGYPREIDKSIVKALEDEARYMTDQDFYDDEARDEYIESYIRRELESASKLATPFIEPPVGEVPRHINTCAFSENAFEGAGAYAEDVKRLLVNSYNGSEVKDNEFSKYEILFYSSLYGFCATNLPKYTPEFVGIEMRPEGEYHRAYFATVNQLSPNLKENSLITPHIDKNWHLICALPDLNERHEKILQNDIVHAFLYGLIFQQFDSEHEMDKGDIFYVKATSNRGRLNLWVSNGTPCDRFYEVFDSLKYSPPAVYRLLDQSAERLDKERNDAVAPSVRTAQFVKQIKTDVFDKDSKQIQVDADALAEKILDGIKKLKNDLNVELLPKPYVLLTGGLTKTCVTNLFGYGIEDTPSRTSLLEIPLLYHLSLPQTEMREGELDSMVESIFGTVEEHLDNFCDGDNAIAQACKLFEQQYLLFEWNLLGYEKAFPSVNTSKTVGLVREKTLSYLEQSPARFENMSKVQNRIKDAWSKFNDPYSDASSN